MALYETKLNTIGRYSNDGLSWSPTATRLWRRHGAVVEDGHCLSGQALDVCPAKQRRNRSRLHAMTLETLRHVVATGAGYTLLPSLAVGSKPPLTDLIRYMKLGGKRQYGRKIVLAWRHSFSRETDIGLFAELIRNSLPATLKQR